MKVAVPALGETLDSPMDRRLGRCRYFIIYDTETGKYEVMANPGATSQKGAGPRAVKALRNAGVQKLITAHACDNSQLALKKAEIQYTIIKAQTVEEALKSVL